MTTREPKQTDSNRNEQNRSETSFKAEDGRRERQREPNGRGGAEGADEGRPLVTTANNFSALSTSRSNLRKTRKMAAERAQRLISDTCGDLKAAERIAKCGNTVRSAQGVAVKRSTDGYTYASGVATCGSIWCCVSCSFKIRLKRAADIAEAVRVHIANGGGVLFTTLTISHEQGEDLDMLWSLVQGGWSFMADGRPWRRFKEKYGLVGSIKAVEVTNGVNGWHPHLHVLWFVDRPMSWFDDDPTDFWDFRAFLRERWVTYFAERHGQDLSQRFGVRTDPVTVDDADTVGEYVTKVGYELAMCDTKIGRDEGQRHPFAIARDASDTGDMADIRLLREWLVASKGRKAIQWSYGLRTLLIGGQEKSDEELAAEDELGSETVAELDGDLWSLIARRRDGAKTRFLICFEHGGGGVAAALYVLGCYGIDAELAEQSPGDPPKLRLAGTNPPNKEK